MKVFEHFYYSIVEDEGNPLVYITEVSFFNKNGRLQDNVSRPHVKLIETMAGICEMSDSCFEPCEDISRKELEGIMRQLGFSQSDDFDNFVQGSETS